MTTSQLGACARVRVLLLLANTPPQTLLRFEIHHHLGTDRSLRQTHHTHAQVATRVVEGLMMLAAAAAAAGSFCLGSSVDSLAG
jgi:hypothetical protein